MDRNQSDNRKAFKKLNNKGFTLVELLVVFAILAVVGGIVFLFLQSGTKSYQSTSKEVDMQYDAQVLLNQIENYIIDTNLGLAGEDNTVCIYNKDETGITQETISWEPEDKILYYEKRKEANGHETILVEKTVIAENVAQFSMDVSKADSQKKVEAEVELEKEEKSYKAKATWNLRNDVLSMEEAEDEYEVEGEWEDSLVTSVKVYASRTVLIPGEEQIFYSRVYGGASASGHYSSQSVVWDIEGEITSGGTYITEDGTLHTGTDEEAEEITVVAQSVEKPSVMGRLTIQMDPGGIEITPREIWVGVTGNQYDPHSYGNSETNLQVKIKESVEVDLSNLTWDCNRETYEESLKTQEDLTNKTIQISSAEDGGNIIIQVFAEDENGKVIRSNQVVIHVVKMIPARTTIKDNDGFEVTIKSGLEEMKTDDIQYASSFEDILYNKKNCRFYVYDAKEQLRFWRLNRDMDGRWRFYVYYDKRFSIWDKMFEDPLSAYVTAGLYEAGTLEKKTDLTGDSFYYGFSVNEYKILQ